MDAESPTTDLSFRLSQAVSTGRTRNARPDNREAVLLRLLMKRAAAHRAGLSTLEEIMLRQILWSLPMVRDPEHSSQDIAA